MKPSPASASALIFLGTKEDSGVVVRHRHASANPEVPIRKSDTKADHATMSAAWCIRSFHTTGMVTATKPHQHASTIAPDLSATNLLGASTLIAIRNFTASCSRKNSSFV